MCMFKVSSGSVLLQQVKCTMKIMHDRSMNKLITQQMTDITTDGQLVIAVKEGLKAMETQKWTTQQGKGTIQKWKDQNGHLSQWATHACIQPQQWATQHCTAFGSC